MCVCVCVCVCDIPLLLDCKHCFWNATEKLKCFLWFSRHRTRTNSLSLRCSKQNVKLKFHFQFVWKWTMSLNSLDTKPCVKKWSLIVIFFQSHQFNWMNFTLSNSNMQFYTRTNSFKVVSIACLHMFESQAQCDMWINWFVNVHHMSFFLHSSIQLCAHVCFHHCICAHLHPNVEPTMMMCKHGHWTMIQKMHPALDVAQRLS